MRHRLKWKICRNGPRKENFWILRILTFEKLLILNIRSLRYRYLHTVPVPYRYHATLALLRGTDTYGSRSRYWYRSRWTQLCCTTCLLNLEETLINSFWTVPITNWCACISVPDSDPYSINGSGSTKWNWSMKTQFFTSSSSWRLRSRG